MFRVELESGLLGRFAAVKKNSEGIQPAMRLLLVASAMGPNHNGERLALPDVLAASAGDCIGGKSLFQRLPTNRTFFLPHIHTRLFFLIGLARKSLLGRDSSVCSKKHQSKSVSFWTDAPPSTRRFAQEY